MMELTFRPHFRAWLAEQSASAHSAIDAKIAAARTDPKIQRGHRHADYARRAAVIAYCTERNGYKPDHG